MLGVVFSQKDEFTG